MQILVNKNYVEFDANTKINKREFKATPLRFIFTPDYDGLTCKAVFSKIASGNEEVTFYQEPIINGCCYIPYEVMGYEGVLIGVYGYDANGNELILRYSPSPKKLWFLEGSYYEGAESPEEINPSQFEQYTAYLNSQIEKLNRMKIETREVSNGVKISVTNSDGITTETEVYNGETGPQGPQGETGPAGSPGRDGVIQYTAGSNISISEENVISATDTTYTAGDNITIENGVISATDTTYEAGTGIDITNNVISATGGGSENLFVLTNGDASANLIAIAQDIIDFYIDNGFMPTVKIIYGSGNNKEEFNTMYWRFNNNQYTFGVYYFEPNSNNYTPTPKFIYTGKLFINVNNTTENTVTGVTIPANSNSNVAYRSGYVGIPYQTASYSASYEDYVKKCMFLSLDNTKAYTPTPNSYNPATTKYVDDKLTTYSGYDATKTQVLKNINGTFTWVDEV